MGRPNRKKNVKKKSGKANTKSRKGKRGTWKKGIMKSVSNRARQNEWKNKRKTEKGHEREDKDKRH